MRRIIINTILLMFILLSLAAIVSIESGIFKPPIKSEDINIKFQTISNNFSVNEEFYLDILIDTTEPINLVESSITYDSSIVIIDRIETQNSFANVFTHKEIIPSESKVLIIGGLPSPGYKGKDGLFARIYFKAISSGTLLIELNKDSKILANNGRANNFLQNFHRLELTID